MLYQNDIWSQNIYDLIMTRSFWKCFLYQVMGPFNLIVYMLNDVQPILVKSKNGRHDTQRNNK